MFEFDEVAAWGPRLRAALAESVPADAARVLADRHPEYIEDALRDLFEIADRTKVVASTVRWIEVQQVAAYHGSRLTEQEIEAVRTEGLIALRAADREERLRRVFASHDDWPARAAELREALELMGPKGHAGDREGQVHVTLSRSGLLHGFNHYLTHGSEFDQHIAHRLFGEAGKALLGSHGRPVIFKLAFPGAEALEATNRFGVSDVPNLIREVLMAWAYWLAYPEFSSASLCVDCGLIYYEAIPPACIIGVETPDIRE